MVDRADVVVVGAGLGGLAAAVTAAGHGRNVIVLEQGDTPGGYASCFQRGPYRFDTSLHALNGLAPGGGADRLYRDLGIWDRLHLARLDPLYVARYPDVEVVAHADRFRYESELIRHFPDQALAIRALLDEQVAAHRDMRRLQEDQAAGRRASLDEFTPRYPVLARLSGETAEQTASRFVPDARARAVLGSHWPYLGVPPSRLSSAVLAAGIVSYHDYGGWYPEGGSGAISRALVDSLHARGGEIRYGQKVVAMEFTDGRVDAVVTAAGDRVHAEAVISNASAPTTLLTMVGRDRLPADYVARVESPAASYTTFGVYLGLDHDLFAERGLPHELFIFPGYDHDAAHQAALAGDWGRTGLTITDYTRVDPGCAPGGHAVIVIMTEASWEYGDIWGTGGDLADYHTNPRYLSTKQRVADTLVALADTQLPGLAAAIRYQEASTPLTNLNYTANPKGAIEGYENTPENSGLGWLPQTTPIANLYLAGAWTNTGGQNPAMQSGVSAATRAARAELATSA